MISAELVAAAKSAPLPGLIGAEVKLTRQGRRLVGLCPFHTERTPSFVVYPDHYFCFGCGATGDAISWLRAKGLSFRQAVDHLTGRVVSRLRPIPRAVAPDDDQRNIEIARRIWCESLPIEGTAAGAYLAFRGLQPPSAPVLRFHPACPRADEKLPAIVALLTDPVSGDPRGIHRTFIQPDGQGKAEGKAKMMLGRGGVVRLAEASGEALGIAEGIETALAVAQLVGWGPVWATCGRSGIAAFPVIPHTTLSVFADSNRPGVEAAAACANRWNEAGSEVWVHVPPTNHSDWLDLAISLQAR